MNKIYFSIILILVIFSCSKISNETTENKINNKTEIKENIFDAYFKLYEINHVDFDFGTISWLIDKNTNSVVELTYIDINKNKYNKKIHLLDGTEILQIKYIDNDCVGLDFSTVDHSTYIKINLISGNIDTLFIEANHSVFGIDWANEVILFNINYKEMRFETSESKLSLKYKGRDSSVVVDSGDYISYKIKSFENNTLQYEIIDKEGVIKDTKIYNY